MILEHPVTKVQKTHGLNWIFYWQLYNSWLYNPLTKISLIINQDDWKEFETETMKNKQRPYSYYLYIAII